MERIQSTYGIGAHINNIKNKNDNKISTINLKPINEIIVKLSDILHNMK
jgi:hypothetical protein